jgi:hypothetical protein
MNALSRTVRWLLALILLKGALLATPIHAFSPEQVSLSFSVPEIRHPLFELRNLKLDWQGNGSGAASVERMILMGQHWSRVGIVCPHLSLKSGAFRCESGHLSLPGLAPIALTFRQEGKTWRLVLRPENGERWEIVHQDAKGTRLEIQNGRPDLLLALIPQLADLKKLKPAGRLNGHLEYRPERFTAALALAQGRYASADGREAAENLEATLTLSGKPRHGKWHAEGRLTWDQGEIYSDPLFLKSDRQQLVFSGALDARSWTLERAALRWPQVGEIVAEARGNWEKMEESRFSASALELSALGDALLRPFLEGQGLPKVDLSGRIGLKAILRDGALAHLELTPQETGLNLENGRLTLEGLSGHLRWRNDAPGEGHLEVRKLALGRLESGAFHLPLAIWPQGFALSEPTILPLLDGAMALNHLAAGFGPDGWEGALGLSVEPLSLDQLTPALDLPLMSGKLSANLPLIRYANGEAALDGAMVIQAFDGYFNCRDLRLIDPFGARPRILANVDAEHIDLAQLTQTFSFGEITGFINARLNGLELAAWQPLAFDARIESSPGRYPRRISQRAVDNIAALSGGGMMASLQASALRMFENFGYRRIGLSCRLENGVCHMAGIPGSLRDDRFVIVEGGGIPALSVMGYNHRVDWEELVTRVKAAIEAHDPIIE